MKKALVLLSVMVLAVAAGCGTRSQFIAAPGAEALNPSQGFKVGIVSDRSNFPFPDKDKDAFDLKAEMAAALQTELGKAGLSLDAPAYSVNVDILAYAPGNAFARWLFPGAGATKLTVEAVVLDKKSVQVAKIPVDRHISAGGGYTIGAYKYIFVDVAQEIAAILKDPARKTNAKTNAKPTAYNL